MWNWQKIEGCEEQELKSKRLWKKKKDEFEDGCHFN
jgi:hypothetical protein